MKISKQNQRDAKQLFRSCTVDGVLDENRVRQAIDQVLQIKPRGYIGILSHFEQLVRLEQERRTAKIESATALPGDLQNAYKATLEKRYGRGLHFIFRENPALLGGVRVQVGSDVFDGSVRARLNEISDSFKAA